MRKDFGREANNPSTLDLGRGPNNRVAQIEESEVVRKLLERVDMLESAKAAVQFPPGFEPGAKPPNNEGRPSTDEMLSLIYKEMKEMREQDSKVNEYMKSNSNQMKNMEAQQKAMDFQLGQLATTVGNMQNNGKFPSTTEPNPKEHCKAIELRSGTKY
ncbi:hypothetical protein ACS0TY_006032 [Phlomoides rotata]